VASFSLSYKSSVEKDLQSVPRPLVVRILAQIEHLSSDPFPPQSAKLQGAERLYRLRVGDYRVVYEVDSDARHILVHTFAIDGMCIDGFRNIMARRLFMARRAHYEWTSGVPEVLRHATSKLFSESQCGRDGMRSLAGH
jgi:mRNA interferase RelE/StbE